MKTIKQINEDIKRLEEEIKDIRKSISPKTNAYSLADAAQEMLENEAAIRALKWVKRK